MRSSYVQRASSLEHDVLRCILDQIAVGHIIDMGRQLWNADASTTWAVLQDQAALGRVRAYRGEGPYHYVDLAHDRLADVEKDYELWVEPTEETFVRLNEIGAKTAP
jgi:hypothetical protein